MKFKLLLFVVFVFCVSIFTWDAVQSQPNKQSPARSIFIVSVDPLACKESETFYNITTHSFKVCTGVNTLSAVSFGSGSGGGTLFSLNGLSTGTQTFAVGSSGSDFNISSSGTIHTFNTPSASASSRGFLTATDWITFNAKGDLSSTSVQTISGAKTFNAGKLIVGTNSSAPAVTANSFYINTLDGRLYLGSRDGVSWHEIFEAGVSGPVSTANGGNGLIGFRTNVTSAAAISITGKVFHVTGTTTITSINTSGIQTGTEITLIFDGILTFTDGSNLKLAGDFTTSADDSITLVFDGTNFYEISRSVN